LGISMGLMWIHVRRPTPFPQANTVRWQTGILIGPTPQEPTLP
jgi:hypothetical protein